MLWRRLRFLCTFFLAWPLAHAALADEVLEKRALEIQGKLEHPPSPVSAGACSVALESELARQFEVIALAFVGREGWALGIRPGGRLYVLGSILEGAGITGGWDWTTGGGWIGQQVAPIEIQLGRSGLKSFKSITVDQLRELARGMPCALPAPRSEH